METWGPACYLKTHPIPSYSHDFLPPIVKVCHLQVLDFLLSFPTESGLRHHQNYIFKDPSSHCLCGHLFSFSSFFARVFDLFCFLQSQCCCYVLYVLQLFKGTENVQLIQNAAAWLWNGIRHREYSISILWQLYQLPVCFWVYFKS